MRHPLTTTNERLHRGTPLSLFIEKSGPVEAELLIFPPPNLNALDHHIRLAPLLIMMEEVPRVKLG